MEYEGNRKVATSVHATKEGGGGEAGAGCSLSGSENQGLPSILEGQDGPGGPYGPSGTDAMSSQSSPDTPNGQGGADASNGQGGPGANNHNGSGVLGSPGIKETVGSAAFSPPKVTWVAHASEPSIDAKSVAIGPGK